MDNYDYTKDCPTCLNVFSGDCEGCPDHVAAVKELKRDRVSELADQIFSF